MKYAVIIEKTSTGYSAHAPDVPGCGVAGETYEETLQLLREALRFHLEGMIADGETIPQPTTQVDAIELDAPSKAA